MGRITAEILKNNLKIPNKEDFKEIITGALVLVIAAQIGGTANHIIKNSDLNNIPYIEEVYKIATSEYDNMVSNGVDIMNSIKDNNVKFDENSILKIKQCVTNNSKTYEDITKFKNHMIYDSEIS